MKNIIILSLAVILIVAVSGCVGQEATQQQQTPQQNYTAPPAQTPAAPPAYTAPPAGPTNWTVQMTEGGFDPKTITIKAGDTIIFSNTGRFDYWPASDPHPMHSGYPAFDAKRNIASGKSWSFSFYTKGTFGYHDDMNQSSTGTIIVQ